MKKNWKRVGVIALALLMVIMLLPLGSFKAQAEEGSDEDVLADTDYKVGDIIKFGQYEQDGNLENGKEEIEWQVLKVESGKVLVVSKYALDCKPYHTKFTGVCWEYCSLRKWLNNDFKNAAFTAEEQTKIPTVTIENKDNPNPEYEIVGGKNTNDQIFCLSLEEIESYFGNYSWYDSEFMRGFNQNLICTPTQYAENNGAYAYTITESDYNSYLKDKGYTRDVIGRRGSDWWLRSPGRNGTSACQVAENGYAGTVCDSTVSDDICVVRPALFLNLSSDYPLNIELNMTSAFMASGEETTMTATLSPETVIEDKITWTSSNPEVATVIDGEVKAIGVGEATITATTVNDLTATCEVTVIAESSPYKVGDIIKFGHYEQDGDETNGKEEIEWEVLKVESGRVLVVSKYALDCTLFDTEDISVTWEKCSLRSWLNNDFKNIAFTSAEQEKIPTVTIENKRHPRYGGGAGNNTNDQIFCLSLEEVESYFGDYNWYSSSMYGYKQNLICTPTQYAINNNTYYYDITEDYYNSSLKDKGYTSDVIGRRGSFWWLRSPGYDGSPACAVDLFGFAASFDSVSVGFDRFAVRPALFIDISDFGDFFADIKSGTWQYKAAKAVYDKGYMTGTGTKDGKIVFSPNTDMNRTMFVQALYSMDGKPEVTYVQKFSDVKESAWYAKAVTWASNNGVVAGNPDGTFSINGKATREQMALMLYKYAVYKKYDVNISDTTSLDNFTDANKVDSWALTAVKWAVERGIISGKGNASTGYRIAPTEKATRIECAAMLNKFSEVYADAPKIGEEDLEEPLALPEEEIEDFPMPADETEDVIIDDEEEETEDEDIPSEDENEDEDVPSEDENEDVNPEENVKEDEA